MDKIDQMLHKKEKYLQFCIVDYEVVYVKSTSEDKSSNRKEKKEDKKTQFLEQVLAYAEKHPTKGKTGNGKEGIYFCLDEKSYTKPSPKNPFKRKKKKRKRSRDLYICIKKSHYEKIAKEYDFLKNKQQKEVTVSDMQEVISHILYDYLGIEESGCLIVANPIFNLPLHLQKQKKIQKSNSTPDAISNEDLLFFDPDGNYGFDFDFDLKEGWPSSVAINNVSIILGFPEGPLKIKEKKKKRSEMINVQPDTSGTKQHESNPTIIDLPGYFRDNDIDPDALLSPEKERSSLDDLSAPQYEDTNNILTNNPLKSLALLITAGFGISTLKNKRLTRPQKKKKKGSQKKQKKEG